MEKQYYYEPYSTEVLCQYKKTKGYQTFPYHRHNGFEIYLFLSGNIRVYVESNCYEPTPGQFLLIPPSCMHRIVSQDNGNYERVTINIKQSVLEKMSTSKTDLGACFSPTIPVPISLSETEKEDFVRICQQLNATLDSVEFGADVEANILVGQLLLLLNRCCRRSVILPDNLMPPLVKEVMLYIQQHLTEKLTLEILGEKLYRSGTYISRLFKAQTGLTLREYILDCRIEHAKKLLMEKQSVSEACYGSGFGDYANFIRTFTRKVGVSPGKYGK
nr:helix-turn-helix transcriptional regulator [Eubacterium sp.]